MQRVVNDYSFAHFTAKLLLHYLGKYRSCSLAVYSNKNSLNNSACIGAENRRDHKSLKICYLFHMNQMHFKMVHVRQRTDRRINSEWAALSLSVIERAVGELRQRLRACDSARNRNFDRML